MFIPYANRGMDFENLINASNDAYRSKGIALIVKVPTEFIPLRKNGQLQGVKVTRKSVCDYLGEYKGRPIAIEAKTTTKDSISKNVLKEHQASFLGEWESMGGLGFVLVSFRVMDFVCVPWSMWNDLERKTLRFQDFSENLRFGLGGRVPIDYLKVVDKFLGWKKDSPTLG